MDCIFGVNFFGVWNGVLVFGKCFVVEEQLLLILNMGFENFFFIVMLQLWFYVVMKYVVWVMIELLCEEVFDYVGVGFLILGFVNMLFVLVDVGMDVDEFIEIVMLQIKVGEFYIVMYLYNVVKIEECMSEICDVYVKYVLCCEGDQVFDVCILFEWMVQ